MKKGTERGSKGAASMWRRQLKYIDYLVATRGGEQAVFRLNGYRQDVLRGVLVDDLARLARNYNPAKVPEFEPFAMAMLKRKVSSGARWQGSAQCSHLEGALGYISLDAPLENSSDDSDATAHDIVADEAGAARGVRGERLRRFYRVMSRLTDGEREILEMLMDCEMNKTAVASALGLSARMFRYRLRFIFEKFRAIWSVTD